MTEPSSVGAGSANLTITKLPGANIEPSGEFARAMSRQSDTGAAAGASSSEDRVTPAAVFSEGASTPPHVIEPEGHPNDTPGIDKGDLGRFQIASKTERFNLIDATMTHALATATLGASPSTNETMNNGLNAIMNLEIASSVTIDTDSGERPVDIESQEDLGDANEALWDLKSKAESARNDLATADGAKTEFLDWKNRQADGETTMGDKAQRHIFGKEAHAVFLRSLAQSVVVVGFASSMQAATGAMMKNFFEGNPDAIPSGILEQAKENLGKDATDSAIQEEAIELLSKPGSTYLDAETASAGAIFGSEAGVGAVRGVLVPIADSQNEMDIRKDKVNKSVSTGSEQAGPTGEKTAGQKFSEAFNRSMPAQLKANMQSGALAAAVGLVGGGKTTGLKAAVDIGKALGFGGMAAASNAAADGFRSAVYSGDNETVTQGIKVGGRVAGRGVAQLGKLAMSYAQSGIEGKMDTRSPAGDMIKAIGIQVGLSGTAKEVIGAFVQRLTSASLPPNDRSMLASADALVSMKELMVELADTSNPAVQMLDEETRTGLIQEISTTLANAYTANNINFADDEFDGAYEAYETERTGTSPLANTDEIV